MSRPQLVVAEKNNLPILIIDREGSVGLGLYSKLKEHLQIVLVGGREPQTTHNILFLPLRDHIPTIPSDQYSHIIIITETERDVEDILPSCIEKARADNAKLFLVLTTDVIEGDKIAEIIGSSREIIIVLLKDIFGSPYKSKEMGRIEKLFYQAKVKRAIRLSHMGLQKLYPICYEDVLVELLKLAFGNSTSSQFYYLCCRHPITELGLAHSLQRTDPLIKLDFYAEEREHLTELIPGGVFLLSESYPVFAKLAHAYKEYKKDEKINEVDEPVIATPLPVQELQREKEGKKYNNRKIFLALCLIFIVTFFVVPIITTFSFALEGRQVLLAAKDSLQKGDSLTARKYASGAINSFTTAKQFAQAMLWIGSTVSLQKPLLSFEGSLDAGISLAHEIDQIAYASMIIKNILTGYSLTPKDDIHAAISNLQQAITQAEVLVKDDRVPASARQELQKQLDAVGGFSNISEGLPSLLSIKGKKTYALMFQNNMELRPGGGFIGSYALVTFSNGKLEDFTIHDVYDADGQLRGHIEPPFQLRRYLPSAHWYLRDSNFSVDNLKNASQIAFFLQLETGQQIDGVIDIDLSFVKAMLTSLGSVYVPSYNQTVTPDNFFMLTENHAEKNFFPGSTQKKDFLVNLFTAMQQKILQNKISYASLFSEMATAAREKHIIFTFADKPSQDLFTVNGLSSTLWDPRSQANGVLNDYLGINEANLGINKVNYYITRSLDQRVMVNNTGDVSEQVTVTYTNASKDYTWPGGGYKNYLRFILPLNASLVKVMIDGQDQTIVPAIEDFKQYEASNFVPPAGLEVAREDLLGKTTYGFLINVPPNSKKTITVIYVLAQKISLDTITQQYSLDYFKQPGTDQYPYSFSLTYPSTFQPGVLPEGFSNNEGQVMYSSLMGTDLHATVYLGKK